MGTVLSAIYFPDLGLTLDPSRVAFTVFGKEIYWYGIIIAAGFLLAAVYGCRRAKEFGVTSDNIVDMLIFAVPVSLICARAYYCIFSWEEFSGDPVSVFYIWEGGIAIYGGVVGAALTVAVFAKLKKIKAGALMDIGALGLLIGQAVGRWGNFINREAHGTEYTGFLSMGLENASGGFTYYHPTFLYESLWNLAGFVILHFFSKRFRKFDGEIFLLYLAWYGLGRGVIEGLRTDSLYLFGTGLRVSQFLGIASCLVSVVLLLYNLVFKDHFPEEMQVNIAAAKAAQAEAETDAAKEADIS